MPTPTASPAAARAPRGKASVSLATAVWFGLVSAVLVFALLNAVSALWFGRAPAPAAPPHEAGPADLVVWAGRLAPGVRGVLSPEWGRPDWDGEQDARLRAGLGLPADATVAFYRLLAFNESDAPASVALGSGALVVEAADGSLVPSVALAPLLDAAAGRGGEATTLTWLGARRTRVDLPAGAMARLPVAFERRASLEDARAVRSADGSAFERRRITQRAWAALLQTPTREALREP